MKTASFPIPAAPPYGVIQRLKAVIMRSTSELPPALERLANRLNLTRAQDRPQDVTTLPARQNAPQPPPSAFKGPPAPSTGDHTLTAEDMAIVEAWDKQLSSMSEDERVTFVAALAGQIEGTVKEEPPLTLDQQYDALTTTEQRLEFLKANSRIILAH